MRFLLILVVSLVPYAAHANQTIGSIIDTATGLVLYAVPIAAALALLYFLVSMFRLMTSLDSAEKLKQVRPRIIWGIIILFVIMTLGALIAVLDDTFFGSNSQLGQGFNMNQQAPSGVFDTPQGGQSGGSGGSGGSGFDGVWTPPDTGDEEMLIDPRQPRCWEAVFGFSCSTEA